MTEAVILPPISNPMLGQCGRCLFFKLEPTSMPDGRCFRMPPTHHFVIENGQLREACTWPLVKPTKVCGEFRLKPPMEP